MSSNTDIEELRKAIRNDFHSLLVKEFTADWKIQRLVHDCEIDVMDFDNVNKFIQQKVIEAQKVGMVKAKNRVLRRTEIPSDAKNPTRDYVVILGEQIADIIQGDIEELQAQLNHNKKDSNE